MHGRAATSVAAGLTLLAALAGGCARHTVPVAPPAELTAAQRNFQAVWEGARETLKKYDFQLDRQDRRAGVITTLPMTGKHFTEPWRHDAVGPGQVAESTIQTLYLATTVRIRPTTPGAETYIPLVRVDVLRSARPQPQVTSASEAYDLFDLPSGRDDDKGKRLLLDSGRDPAGRSIPITDQLVPLGRNERLEARIAADIQIAAGQTGGM